MLPPGVKVPFHFSKISTEFDAVVATLPLKINDGNNANIGIGGFTT